MQCELENKKFKVFFHESLAGSGSIFFYNFYALKEKLLENAKFVLKNHVFHMVFQPKS